MRSFRLSRCVNSQYQKAHSSPWLNPGSPVPHASLKCLKRLYDMLVALNNTLSSSGACQHNSLPEDQATHGPDSLPHVSTITKVDICIELPVDSPLLAIRE